LLADLAVQADFFEKIFHFRKIFFQNEIFGLVSFQNPVSGEFEPMIAPALYALYNIQSGKNNF